MAQQRAGVEGSGGGKKPSRGGTNPLDAAIKAAKSVDDLAKMGLKVVTAPINKAVDITSGAVKGAVSGAIKGAKGKPKPSSKVGVPMYRYTSMIGQPAPKRKKK